MDHVGFYYCRVSSRGKKILAQGSEDCEVLVTLICAHCYLQNIIVESRVRKYELK